MVDKPYLNNHLRFKILFHTEPQGVSYAVRSLVSAATCAVHLNGHMVVADCLLELARLPRLPHCWIRGRSIQARTIPPRSEPCVYAGSKQRTISLCCVQCETQARRKQEEPGRNSEASDLCSGRDIRDRRFPHAGHVGQGTDDLLDV